MARQKVTICDVTIPLTLENAIAKYATDRYVGSSLDLWVFDGLEQRMHAQTLLRAKGVEATIRSAYKPLVHAILDEIDLSDVESIRIHYPNVVDVNESRFLLEAYPVAFLTAGRPVSLEPEPRAPLAGIPTYRVELQTREKQVRLVNVLAPNVFKDDHLGESILSSCGWVKVVSPAHPDLDEDGPLDLDLITAFSTAMDAIKTHSWPDTAPYFDRLNVRIEAPFYDREIGVGKECISTAEGMHEDIYFSVLETFKVLAGVDKDERTLQPGQIVPDIVTRPGAIRICVTSQASPAIAPLEATETDLSTLETVDRWLEPSSIKACLDALGGDPYTARSQQGRPVWGTHIDRPGPQVVISAGQHSNETSGPVGALRAAERLVEEGEVGFSLSPLENPDGYALFQELATVHPNHMHHAARYTAGGGDLEYFERGFENEIRYVAREKTGADLHLNLHGYPAHEWTRPFTGYVPKAYENWTIPKGFFMIVRYKAGWQELARIVLDAIVEALSEFAPIMDLNREQLVRFQKHAGTLGFSVEKGVPISVSLVEDSLFPITIITEAPDETIYGEDFVIAHTAQMRVVLAAIQAYRKARPNFKVNSASV